MGESRRTGESKYIDVSKLSWESTSFSGVKVKTLWSDASGEAYTALFRMEPGARLPTHRHTAVEQTFVLEGSLVDAEGVCSAGNFVWRHPGSTHTAHSPDGCLTLAIFQKANQFLEEEEEEKNGQD